MAALEFFGEPRPGDAVPARPLALEGRTEADALFALPAGLPGTSADLAVPLERARVARFEPLPPPTGAAPYRKELSTVLGAERVRFIREDAKRLVFHAVGDTGNINHGAAAQESVAWHMEQQARIESDADRPAFFYQLGDVVYFKGEPTHYEAQFYEPYRHYPPPIFAVAGNHDGYPSPGVGSLQGFMENFCAPSPQHTWMSGGSNRLTMDQPNVYWTLRAPFITLVGLYSNVEGLLDAPGDTTQLDWLVGEMHDAPADAFLALAVHHPPYSMDDSRGPNLRVLDVLDRAIQRSGRQPHLVLSGHVHNYQRFQRTHAGGQTAYVVAGAGGYAGYDSLHRVVTQDVLPADTQLARSNDQRPGFLRLTVQPETIKGEYFITRRPPNHLSGAPQRVDHFQISR